MAGAVFVTNHKIRCHRLVWPRLHLHDGRQARLSGYSRGFPVDGKYVGTGTRSRSVERQ